MNQNIKPWGPGIVEARRLAAKLYGIRVERALIPKLKRIKESSGIIHTDPKSNLFCVQMDSASDSLEDALARFKKIVFKAGLGSAFGIES